MDAKKTNIPPIACRDSCGRTTADEQSASAGGWEYLPIARRWRCPQCWRELHELNAPKEESK